MSGGAPAMPSGALRRWVWASRAVVSPAERAVLLALADYGGRIIDTWDALARGLSAGCAD